MLYMVFERGAQTSAAPAREGHAKRESKRERPCSSGPHCHVTGASASCETEHAHNADKNARAWECHASVAHGRKQVVRTRAPGQRIMLADERRQQPEFRQRQNANPTHGASKRTSIAQSALGKVESLANDRNHGRRRESRHERGKEPEPAQVESTHVRPSDRQQLDLESLVLGVDRQVERLGGVHGGKVVVAGQRKL